MEGTSVSEVNRCPLRLEGFEEPPISPAAFEKAMAEHPVEVPRPGPASELRGGTGKAARASGETVGIGRGSGVKVVRRRESGSCFRRRRRMKDLYGLRKGRGRWDEGQRADGVAFSRGEAVFPFRGHLRIRSLIGAVA